MESNRVFAGVDLSTSRRGLTVALLTPRLDVQSLKRQSLEETVAELSVLRGDHRRGGRPVALRGEPRSEPSRGCRAAEKRRAADPRIGCRPLPAGDPRPAAAPPGKRCSGLDALRLRPGAAACGEWICRRQGCMLANRASCSRLQPAACASVLLGRLPYGRGTLEGRIQRQLALMRERVALPDPMDALEELTAHHILIRADGVEGNFRGG